MNRIEIAIFDETPDFVKGLMVYMNRHNDGQTEVSGFWDKEKFERYIENHGADIVLVPEGYKGCEPEEGCIYVTENEGGEGIYKYRAADEIIRELFSQYDRQAQNSHIAKRVSPVVVYSPDRCIYQTPFALTLAMNMAQTDRVLYINLCENAGFEGILQMKFDRDVSDFIYSLGHYTGSIDSLVSSMAYVTNGFSYIPPMQNSADMYLAGREEWAAFIEKIEALESFDTVILDMGGMVPCFYEVLRRSSAVYMPYIANSYNKARCEQFEETLKAGGCEGVLLERLRIPDMENIFLGTDMLTCWQWGDMGDYVRSVLKRKEDG